MNVTYYLKGEFLMKKLSVLIALLLCVTISGVYATWSFVSENSDIVDKKHETLVTLTDATTTGAAGTFTISSNLVLTIDQKAENDHTAVLVFAPQIEGEEIYLTISFTPAVNASADIKANGVQSELYFNTTSTMECFTDASGHLVIPADPENPGAGVTKKNIFTFGTFESDGNYVPNVTWEKDPSTGVFTATYDETELKNIIQLNGTIILDTKPDYDAFANLLSGNIAAHITDGKINGAEGQG